MLLKSLTPPRLSDSNSGSFGPRMPGGSALWDSDPTGHGVGRSYSALGES